MLAVTRYVVPEAETPTFLPQADDALAALVARPGCTGGRVGRAIDDPTLWTLTTSWESVGAYRRALSNTEVKVRAVPLMYRCLDEPTAFEDLVTWDPATGAARHVSDLG